MGTKFKLPTSPFVSIDKNDKYHLFLNGALSLHFIICVVLLFMFVLFKRYWSPNSVIISILCICKLFVSSLFLIDFLHFIDLQSYDFNKPSILINHYIKSSNLYQSLITNLPLPATTASFNIFHLYLFVSFITFTLYFLISYKLYGIQYKSDNSIVGNNENNNNNNNNDIIGKFRLKIVNSIFGGRKIAVVEIVTLVWIYSLLFMVLQKDLFQVTNLEYSPKSSKKLLIYSLLSLISFGYLLLNIRNRNKNLTISLNSSIIQDNNNNKQQQQEEESEESIKLFNLEISKDIIITKLNECYSQFIYYSTMYYFSITIIYYCLVISTSFWNMVTTDPNFKINLLTSTYQSIVNILPIIDIIFTIVFTVHSITLIYYSNQINQIDKQIIKSNKKQN